MSDERDDMREQIAALKATMKADALVLGQIIDGLSHDNRALRAALQALLVAAAIDAGPNYYERLEAVRAARAQALRVLGQQAPQ